MKKSISVIIFWGAVWGITEATLGYILHSISLNIGWVIWFPCAFYFMKRAYQDSGNLSAILFTSVIAALIKLVDLIMPVRIDKVLNPAVSILLEGIIVFAVYKLLQNKEKLLKHKYLQALTLSIGWRLLYIIYILFLPTYYISISPIYALRPFLEFFVIESVVNSAIIYAYMNFAEKQSQEKSQLGYSLSPVLALFQLAVAVFIQLKA